MLSGRLGHAQRGSGEVAAVLAADIAFVPGDLQLLAARMGLPPAVGHDGDAIKRPRRSSAAVTSKVRAHARSLRMSATLDRTSRPPWTSHFWNDGVEHAGHADFDAEDRLPVTMRGTSMLRVAGR